MLAAKSAVIICDVFPPVAAVGVHRTVGLCRHLSKSGWNVTVITAKPKPEANTDRGLLDGVPREVRVVRTPSPDLPLIAARLLKRGSKSNGPASAGHTSSEASANSRTPRGIKKLIDWLSWWIHVPDGVTGWTLPAVRAGMREIGRSRPDVVFSTAPAWTSHLVGGVLARLFRIPWVADFQDPWCGSAWRRIPYGAHRALDEGLERFVVRHAAHITCAWDGIRKHLVARYPERAKSLETILFGYDEAEISSVSARRIDDKHCVLLHAGTFYVHRSPFPLLEGLKHLRKSNPENMLRLSVVFLGPPDFNGRPLRDIVREYGVEDIVTLMPSVPHREALSYVKGCDVALLFGQSGSEALASVPAKTFEYVGFGKPVLAIGAGEEAVGIIERAGCPVWRVGEKDPEACASALAEVIRAHSRGELRPPADDRARSAFSRASLSERLADVLESAARMR